jgi:hypothetical protein
LDDGDFGFDDRGLGLGWEIDFRLAGAVVFGLAVDAGAAELATTMFEADAGEEIVNGLNGGWAVWRELGGLPWHDSHFIGREALWQNERRPAFQRAFSNLKRRGGGGASGLV